MPIFIGVHSTPLHPNFIMFVVILKLLGCSKLTPIHTNSTFLNNTFVGAC
ncbi:hypothetical protein [Moraxella lacunata]